MKLSTFLAALSWSSVIILLWFMVFGRVPANGTTVFAFAFFFVVALLSSGYHGMPTR